ncbi:MAG: polysaccharide biosynthesis protein [Chloroflexota bacterium]
MPTLQSLRNRHFFIADLIIVAIVGYLSFALRLERLNIAPYWLTFAVFTTVALLLMPAIFQAAGLYSRYWRYASINEVLALLSGAGLAVSLSYIVSSVILNLTAARPLPLSVPIIFLFLVSNSVTFIRLSVRVLRRSRKNARNGDSTTVAIMGAGDAGEKILREILNSQYVDLSVAGLLDDDKHKHGVSIHGVPVLGDRRQIPAVVRKYNVQQIIIAMPSAPGDAIREITAICKEAGVPAKTIPGIYELLDGRVSVSQIRDVDINDLLRRDMVRTDTVAVGNLVRGRRVLVTGAGGSIGSELCRQLIAFAPGELHLVGHGENAIFDIYHELRKRAPNTTLIPIIADVRDEARISAVFEERRPQIIFHAAAHKHVPLMEANPSEAITNNILGTGNLLCAAKATGIERFVLISTDKAVNPSSIMGASKRVAELLVHRAAAETRCPYVVVRFGNVLGSRGSVVETFQRQIRDGGPVTVTDRQMKRYFMTIPEAVQLVMQAAVLGEGGEAFVLDMGQPVKIVDLAQDMIELSGLRLGRDIHIEFIGRRPGEKLFEELFIEGETYNPTAHEKIFIAQNAGAFAASITPAALEETIEALVASARRNDRLAIIRSLKMLVPEFKPAGEQEKKKPTAALAPPPPEADPTATPERA